MKRLSGVRAPAIFLFVLLAVMAWGCSGDQRGSEGNRTIILPAGETHDGWYFAAGQRVIINGTVNGDAYIAAGQVEINGVINGDLLVAGGDLEIGGNITDDLRAAGGNVRMNGSVGKNASVAGGNVTVRPTALIKGGLLTACGSLTQGGSVEKDLRAEVGEMEVTGSVGMNTDVAGGRLTVRRGATIGGNLTAILSQKDRSEIAEGAVKGSISLRQKEEAPSRILGIPSGTFIFKAFWFGSLLVTGLVLFLLSRRTFADYGAAALNRFGMSLLWGLLVVIGTPIVALILCITLIGIPPGLILLALYLIVLYLSQLSAGLAAGMKLFGLNATSGWILYFAFVVGTLIYQGLSLIPVLGILLEIFVLLLGSGAIVLLVKGRVKGGG
jgi:cytoskeletal protein CcmA (bactofilin family)